LLKVDEEIVTDPESDLAGGGISWGLRA